LQRLPEWQITAAGGRDDADMGYPPSELSQLDKRYICRFLRSSCYLNLGMHTFSFAKFLRVCVTLYWRRTRDGNRHIV
jgi:hypothetical protein